MKLYMTMPSGASLGINVLLTGLVKESSGTITRVEIYMPTGGHLVVGHSVNHAVVGYSIQALPRGRGSEEVLWVEPHDLRSNNGATVTQDMLRAEAARVREMLRVEERHGPLGENWP